MIDQTESVTETSADVANQIRILREQRSLSQRELAEASGLSRNTLSLIERGQTSPTVSTLKRLALALQVDINAFFEHSDRVNIVYTRANQRSSIRLDQVVMADLGAGMLKQLVTPLILHLDPDARSGPPITHDGQDFVFCLKGELLYILNEQAFILQPGDSLLFDAHLEHRFQNTSNEVTEILLILTISQDSKEYIGYHFPVEHGSAPGL